MSDIATLLLLFILAAVAFLPVVFWVLNKVDHALVGLVSARQRRDEQILRRSND